MNLFHVKGRIQITSIRGGFTLSEQHRSFEDLKHQSEDGFEFCSARELAPLLEYRDWRNFENVISKAVQACEHSNHRITDHFVDVTKMVLSGSGSLH
ncbi:hypothetical protein [Pseudomonas sp. GM25]|uniref:hypothetical protein n=1 Tax=Pseudomonas sp. GM25 TaxID=1144327 RepID=UPI00027057CD|nr:hypothetical protein [Pseudomonas sp. GM25]EJM28225.1 hypothetical protein PMI24_02415 [Pseudomonas sp. GM25]